MYATRTHDATQRAAYGIKSDDNVAAVAGVAAVFL